MKKYVNLVVFIDGTGNNSFETDPELETNIARMWHASENAQPHCDVAEQLVFYRPGVGTRRGELIRGGYFGRYLSDRVTEAKSWLENEISLAEEDGKVPRIFLFGFSRGAYAVRVLANELNHEVWFMGVFDTVKATLTGPDVREVGPHIKHIYHAMAIDEHRGLFNVERFAYTMQATEVWFAGCHADVGGGYRERELSDVSLDWMSRIAEDYGLSINKAVLGTRMLRFETMPTIHDETRKALWKIVGVTLRDGYINRETLPGDKIHASVKRLMDLGYRREWLPDGLYVI